MFDVNELFKDINMPRVSFGKMLIDLKDLGDYYELITDMPGYEKNEISIELEDGLLTISAIKNSETEDNSSGYVKKERFTGKLTRSIQVGEEVNPNDIKASMKNGVLTITFPKVEPERKTNKINIE